MQIIRKSHLRGRGPHIPPLDRVQQYDFQPGYVVFTMPCPKRLRAQLGGVFIADTVNALTLWETEHQLLYYFPVADIRMDLMTPSGQVTHCPFKGEAHHYTAKIGERVVENVMWRYPRPIAGCPPIGDYAAFYWNKIDHWYEEDEEVFVHPRDPYRRIDCLPSSRPVEVFLNGVAVAESRRSVFLHETGLPTRYYLPREDVLAGILGPSDHHSACPYKGQASYHHLTVAGRTYENFVWYYPDPKPELASIKDRICFPNEFVDRLLVDGVEQPRPQTAYSHGL